MAANERSLARLLSNYRKVAEARQAELKGAEMESERANGPFQVEQKALSERWNADPAVRAAAFRKELANKRVWAAEVDDPDRPGRKVSYAGAVAALEQKLGALRASKKVPTTAEEFQAYLTAGAGPFPNFGRHSYRMNVREPQAIGLYLLLSADDGFDRPEQRVYLAVTTLRTVRGWLLVEPSQHPGDESRASGEVNGQPFLVAANWRGHPNEPSLHATNPKKPLAQFKAALKGDLMERNRVAAGVDYIPSECPHTMGRSRPGDGAVPWTCSGCGAYVRLLPGPEGKWVLVDSPQERV